MIDYKDVYGKGSFYNNFGEYRAAEDKKDKMIDNIYVLQGVSGFGPSHVTSFDSPIIGLRGIGEDFIPSELQKDIRSGKIKISLQSKADYVRLLKLCIKYSQYVDYQEAE